MLSRKRHLLKAISWRFFGSSTTFLLSWLVTGNMIIGLSISGIETFTKIVLYYLHERLWFKSDIKNTNRRHALKTLTWRVIGTIDTIIIAWLFLDNVGESLNFGLYDTTLKLVLYYVHEKIWYRIDFGLTNRKNKSIKLK